MKKIVCLCWGVIMVLMFVGTAYASDLRDTWAQLDYVYDFPGHGFIALDNAEEMVDEVPIGYLAKGLLQHYGFDGNVGAEELLVALAQMEADNASTLSEVASEINIADVKLVDSDLVAWWSEETGIVSWDEFYLMNSTLYLPEGEMHYEILVYLWGDKDVGEGVESIVLYEEFFPYEFDASAFDDCLGDMYVVNCEEWVSLRSAMDTDSKRLEKVPKGALVEDVYILNSSDFAFCSYQGQTGYILRDYLGHDKEEETRYDVYYNTSNQYDDYYGTSVVSGVDKNNLASNDDGIYLIDYSASSRLKDSERTYPASNMFDGNLGNAWSDGVKGEGVGETIQVVWTAGGYPYEAVGIAICNGYQKTEKIYNKNSRPKDVLIDVNGHTFAAKLIDTRDGWQSVIFDFPVPFDCEAEVTLLIDSVYAGNQYEDTCITELDLLVREMVC